MFDLADRAVDEGISAMVSWFAELPSRALGAISGLMGDMWQFGVNMIQSLINGIGSMAGRIGSSIGHTVEGGVNSLPVVGGIAKSLGFATGTDNYPGGWGIVGEKGPELVNLPQGSQIFNDEQTRNILGHSATGGAASPVSLAGGGGGGGNTLVVSVNNPQIFKTSDIDPLVEAISNRLAQNYLTTRGFSVRA